MSKKGQVLVLFVFCIPVVITLVAFIVDTGNLWYHSNRLNGINQTVLRYGLRNQALNNLRTTMIDLVNQNDKDIDVNDLKINNNLICLSIDRTVYSVFGTVVGNSHYQLESRYCGSVQNSKIVIEKG